MARPRLPTGQLTKAALWKRAHREKHYIGSKGGNKGDKSVKGTCSRCGKRTTVSEHHTDKNYGRTSSSTQTLCASCHNKAR